MRSRRRTSPPRRDIGPPRTRLADGSGIHQAAPIRVWSAVVIKNTGMTVATTVKKSACESIAASIPVTLVGLTCLAGRGSIARGEFRASLRRLSQRAGLWRERG